MSDLIIPILITLLIIGLVGIVLGWIRFSSSEGMSGMTLSESDR